MDTDEKIICDYLRGMRRQFVSAREICRRADTKKRWQQDPRWAIRLLTIMVDKKLIETDSLGHYRIKQQEKKRNKRERWVAPQIAKILKESGKQFENVVEIEDEEGMLE
ncbi:MAG TPA: hypothetical protein VKA67_04210 [Verrucomicrobiae bacterium]|nr:hypothetical protein [Verrucomicrobiae bacterium]